MPIFLGIDPGAAGALALYNSTTEALHIVDTPTLKVPVGKKLRTRLDCYELAGALAKFPFIPGVAVIEALHSRPQQSAQSQFALGHAVGIVEMAVASIHVPTHFVPPQVWQKAMGVRTDAKGDTKKSSLDRARALFPTHSHLFSRAKDDGRSDAALMAMWGSIFL